MTINGKHLLAVTAVAGAAYLLCKRKGVNGVGAASQDAIDWGANELRLELFNTERIHFPALEKVKKYHSMNFDKDKAVRYFETYIKNRVVPYVHKARGMSFGKEARMIAARDFVDYVYDDIIAGEY